MWNVGELVERYISLAGEFAKPVPLSNFSLSEAELVRLFEGFDEDYHISRYLHFSKVGGTAYRIGTESVTHLSIEASIKEIL